MALFAISDLHLPAREKPMDVFGAHWENHFERIREDWLRRVGEEDVVLLPGDLTWAMRLEDAMEDVARVGELPGPQDHPARQPRLLVERHWPRAPRLA